MRPILIASHGFAVCQQKRMVPNTLGGRSENKNGKPVYRTDQQEGFMNCDTGERSAIM
jgi:hypothetical protein